MSQPALAGTDCADLDCDDGRAVTGHDDMAGRDGVHGGERAGLQKLGGALQSPAGDDDIRGGTPEREHPRRGIRAVADEIGRLAQGEPVVEELREGEAR